MKTKIIVEIDTPDNIEIFPEEEQTDKDYLGKEEELKEFRESFVKGLHEDIVGKAISYFTKKFEEYYLDRLDEFLIEGYNSFEDYKIKIKAEKFKI